MPARRGAPGGRADDGFAAAAQPRDGGDRLVGVDIDEEQLRHGTRAGRLWPWPTGRATRRRSAAAAPRGGGGVGLGGLVRLAVFIGVLAIIVSGGRP